MLREVNKMEKNNWGMAILVGFLCLLVGGFAAYAFFPNTITVKPDKCEAQACIPVDCTPIETEKIVNIPLNAQETYLDTAVNYFLSDKLEDLTICGGEEYDENQIKISKIYEDWSVVFGEDRNDDVDHTVFFTVKLKYLDADVNEKCYSDLIKVKVLYRQDKDPKVTIL